jgi:hypothetical protein
MDLDQQLKIACELNDIQKVKDIIKLSSRSRTFEKLQLFHEMHKSDCKGKIELCDLLAKYAGIQWNMILENFKA